MKGMDSRLRGNDEQAVHHACALSRGDQPFPHLWP
jgi:hypothetical protein